MAVVEIPVAFEIMTLLVGSCIPWFLWFTWIWSPSLFAAVFVIVIAAVIPAKLVPTPDALTCCKTPLSVANAPWTLFTIKEFIWFTVLTVNLIPTPVSPTVAPNTSPVLYPDPPLVTLTAVNAPVSIVIFAVAPLPSPVIVVKLVLL